MDPLTALGLASNVIQVVDFSIRLVSKGVEIYKDGRLVENDDAEQTTQSLRELNGKLQRSIQDSRCGGPLSEEDQSLMGLCASCESIANELLRRFGQIKVTGKHRKWKSARQALKSVTSKDELEELARKLGMYRSEINLNVTVSLRERIDLLSLQQSQRFNNLDSSTQGIMRAILNTKKDIIEAVSTNQATGLHYETGITIFSYPLIPWLSVKAIQSNFDRCTCEATKRTYLLIVRVYLTNSSAEHNDPLCKTLVKAQRVHPPFAFCQLIVEALWSIGACYSRPEKGKLAYLKNLPGLHEAAITGDRSRSRSLLCQPGADVNAKDSNGQTPLHIAATGGHSLLVQTLLNNDAKLEAEDKNGRTALHRATIAGKWAVLRILLASGANQNAEDDYQRTPIQYTEDTTPSECHYACAWIFKHGHDIGARDDDRDTLLLVAAHKGYKPLVDHLLDKGADIEVTGGAGITPLVAAAAQGNENVVSLLLDRRARIEATDPNGSTALIRAAWRGHTDAVRVLLNRGANIEAKNGEQFTALHVAGIYNHPDTVQALLEGGAKATGIELVRASERGRAEIVNLLIKAGADIEYKDHDDTALMIAAYNNKSATVQTLLENGAGIESRRKDGATALWIACYSGHEQVARILLAKGADVESKGEERAFTCLTKASQRGHLPIVQLLLDNGVNIESSNVDGFTALLEAAWQGETKVAELLIARGANVEARDKTVEGYTPLIRAAAEQHRGVMELLLDNGANLEAKSIDGGYTALAKACLYKRPIVSLLLHKGADVEARDFKGRTPIMHAAAWGNKDILKWLLNYGAFQGAKDAAGWTATTHATKTGHHEIVKMLN